MTVSRLLAGGLGGVCGAWGWKQCHWAAGWVRLRHWGCVSEPRCGLAYKVAIAFRERCLEPTIATFVLAATRLV